jgi:hypothetical protein
MNETTMRRALLAAAKVTLSTVAAGTSGLALIAAVGCGDEEGTTAVAERDGGEATEAKGAAAPPPTSTGTTAATYAPPAKSPPSPPTPPTETCADVPCCEAKVGPILTKEDAFAWEPEVIADIQKRLGEDGLACCATLVYGRAIDGSEPRSEAHWACCSALLGTPLEQADGFACTPWGPPMPPVLVEGAASEATPLGIALATAEAGERA